MSNSLYKLRTKRKGNVFLLLTVLLIYFAFCLYCTYNYLQYAAKNGITELSVKNVIYSTSELFTPNGFYLPLTVDLAKGILKAQIKSPMIYVHICSASFFLLILLNAKPKNEFAGVEHGSAHWADEKDTAQFKDSSGIPIAGGFYITTEENSKKSYAPYNLNEVVIGGSGSGKSFRLVKPHLMQMTGSYVVTDPSGELYRDTAQFFRKNHYKVRVLNLNNINFSNSYNPFAYMVSEQDVLTVADLFMKNSAADGEKEDFWTGAAQDLLTMIMIYLFKSPSEVKSFGRVIRLVNSIQYYKGAISDRCELALVMNQHMIEHPDDAASISWNGFLGTPSETMGSICKVLSTRLRLWTVADVDEMTAADEMDFDDIGVHKTIIYLIIPVAKKTYRTVANIFFSQLFERLMYIAELKHHGRLPLLVSCEIDEFPNIGRIPNFSETLSVVRKYNIRICIILQGISQLKRDYKYDFESIIGNCSAFVYLGSNDSDTKEYIVNKRFGKATVRVDTHSQNTGMQGGGTNSESFISRELLTVDEIASAIKKKNKNGINHCIVFVDEFAPFYLYKFDTAGHPKFGELGSRYTGKNMADITKDYNSLHLERSRIRQRRMELERAEQKRAQREIAEAQAQAAAELQAQLAQEFEAAQQNPENFSSAESGNFTFD